MREKIFKYSKAALILMALLELALSQVHIAMITKLFVVEIGFYLFLFIISGLIITFNVSSMKVNVPGKVNQFIIAALASLASGGYFIYLVIKDYNSQDALLFQDVKWSLIFIGVGMAVYLIGAIGILLSYMMDDQNDKMLEVNH